MNMAFKNWLRVQWNDVKGDAKWDTIKWLGGLLLAAVGIAVVWLVGFVVELTHGLTSVQQGRLLAVFVALIVIAAVATTWALSITWTVRRRPMIQDMPALRATAPPPRLSPLPARPSSVRFELQEILFTRKGGLLEKGWYILARLRLTNISDAENLPAFTSWQLEIHIGTNTDKAQLATLPDRWYINRSRPTAFGTTEDREDIQRPTLDKVLEHEGLKRGLPKTGWVLFELSNYQEFAAPYNAEYRLILEDAMGVSHEHVVPPSPHRVIGEVKIDATPPL